MTKSNLMRGSSRSEMINESSAAPARIFIITRIEDTRKFPSGCCAGAFCKREREKGRETERKREKRGVSSRPCLNVSAPSYAGNTP